tara:strand:- start:406 stop:690 length:285 start_codon:yes stop_codon:yes gene_type:complete
MGIDWKNPKAVMKATMSFASALLTGEDVSKDRLAKRLEICAACDLVEMDGDQMVCGICGCKIKEKGLQNLARYEETAGYGCKHPDGSKWKANGV